MSPPVATCTNSQPQEYVEHITDVPVEATAHCNVVENEILDDANVVVDVAASVDDIIIV